MTTARNKLINLKQTPYYHIVSRCVRRTFLCGIDKDSGIDYSHRKQWIIKRMKYLASIFTINIAAYAVMSNHYHLVIHINQKLADSLTDEDVISRSKLLFPNRVKLFEKLVRINPEAPIIKKTISEWRERLSDVGWFMKYLNQPIARMSNQEENCKGHFWEGRYKSQALLDEAALLSAMVYVDLNPIRAGISKTPEDSDYTSIKERITAYAKGRYSTMPTSTNPQPKELMPFKPTGQCKANGTFIPFKLEEYFKVVDETGRHMRTDKKGFIPSSISPILCRLMLNPSGWLNLTNNLEALFANVIGCERKLRAFAKCLRAPKGIRPSRFCYL